MPRSSVSQAQAGLSCLTRQAILVLTLQLTGHRLYYASRSFSVLQSELSDALGRPLGDKGGALHWVLQRIPHMLLFFGDLTVAVPTHRCFLVGLASADGVSFALRPAEGARCVCRPVSGLKTHVRCLGNWDMFPTSSLRWVAPTQDPFLGTDKLSRMCSKKP